MSAGPRSDVTHCPKGHEYTPENTYVQRTATKTMRSCRACRTERNRKMSERRSKTRRHIWPNSLKTHCPQGHPYDAENTDLRNGRRHCRACRRGRDKHPSRRIIGVENWRYVDILRNDVCSYCGGPGGQVDHIDPVADGGPTHWTNLTAACSRCNYRKRKKTLLRFLLETA